MTQKTGPWKVLESTGEGGQAHVFKVRHEGTGQIGALKRLKNLKRKERFLREVETVQKLRDPYIVQVLDVAPDAERPYIVFEWMEGGWLCRESVQGMSTIAGLALIEQLCSALERTHTAGIVHRDIKPENVLLSADRRTAKLGDFGIIHVEDEETLTATFERVGSPPYMCPEQEGGQTDDVKPRCDIYSLGKLLYYVVSGGVLLPREHHRRPQYDLAKLRNDPHLEVISSILDKVLVEDPERRLQSSEELRRLVANAREDLMEQRPVEGTWDTYTCLFCRKGAYEPLVTSFDSTNWHNLGYSGGAAGFPAGPGFGILQCPNCGNTQRFVLNEAARRWLRGKALQLQHPSYGRGG